MGMVARKLPDDVVEVFDCEQKTDDWYELRRGIVTASVFSAVMARGEDGGVSKTRRKLLYQLAGERLTGKTAERYRNSYMDRGNEMEPAARGHYAFTRVAEAVQVGFVRRTIAKEFGPPLVVGCSPDSFVGEDGVLEIKTLAPDLMIELAERGTFPSEHRWQCHGTLWVTGRAWLDLLIFFDGMPIAPSFRIVRSEQAIREVAEGVEIFEHELRKLVKRIQEMGGVKCG